MSDTKMLQAILDKVNKLEKSNNNIRSEMKEGFEKVNKRFDMVDARLDKQGKQLAYLEEDAPTREEHDKLNKRVTKIEKKLASI